MTDAMVTLTIDNQEVACPDGSTVYEAATAAGIHIPTFCHHEKLTPVGACRMCLVEIEGVHGLQTSCTTPAREGMVAMVHTSPAAVKARKANIEFLLTNHPLDCPVCDKGGECPLQDQAMLDGPGQSRYIEDKRLKEKRYPLGEFIVLDQERCVLCWRCIRFLDEWADDHELDLFGRGADTRIDTFPGRPLRSKWQGNTIDICPVGALTSRVFRFEARVWELTNTPSVCAMCAVGCNIELGVKNNELRRITPRENMQVNDVWICDKGRFAHAFVDHPDRLKQPLIRHNGELQPATWDEALDLIARRLGQIIQDSGPQAIAGLGSTRITNEANYLFQRFMRTVVGTHSVDHLRRMPTGAEPLASLPDLEDRDVILLLGCDPSTEAPLVELWIKKAALRHGAVILAASSHRPELAGSGLWLGYRPGTEAILMNGMARAILDAGLERQSSRATNKQDFETVLDLYAPNQVQERTGVSAEALYHAASVLAKASNPIVLYGAEWMQGPTPDASLDALANVSLLLGGIDIGFVAEDCNTLGTLEMGTVPDLYPGGQSVQGADARVRNRLAGLWGGGLSPVEGLGFDGMMQAGKEGSLQAMWIIGSDPARDCQDAGSVLGQIPFLIVQDLFMTDTASLAEVVLPSASFAETDGSYINLTGRYQSIRAAMRPPGLAWPDWWIVKEVAKCLMSGERGKATNAWEFSSAADVMTEIVKVLGSHNTRYRGLDYGAMGEQGWQRPQPERRIQRTFAVDKVGSPAGQAAAPPDYPLILVSGRQFYDRGTLLRCSEPIQRVVPDAFVAIHPVDADSLGLVDGEEVSVVSASGRLGLKARISDEVVPGVVFAPRNLSAAPLSVLGADPWTPIFVRIVK